MATDSISLTGTHWCLCRYVAVCKPLRYPTIMTVARLHICCTLAWIVAVLFNVLVFLQINVPLCGYIIQHAYCSIRVILDLACSPSLINNIYGQFIPLK